MENKDLPVLICRGTHYEVGLLVGKRFKTMIQELLESWKYFHEIVKVGSTASGNDIVQNSLSLCKKKFPGYIDEIKGMSDGSGIQFEQLFMLNIDSLLSSAAESESGQHNNAELRKSGGTGCTSILCNKDEQILGHTEDAMAEIKNHVYIVSAEIIADDINEEGIVLEKFTTLCYAGTLMGYTMGFNNHGMVYSVNTIFPDVKINGTPRAFVARALLGAKNLDHVLEILKDEGHGVADGFSFNVYFYPNENQKRNVDGRGKKLSFYNIEVAPALPSLKKPESIIDIHEVQPGNSYCHCNKYLRLRAHECNSIAVKYSDMRDVALCRYCDPSCKKHVKEMLSDESDFDYPIYNNGVGENYEMDFIRTVAVGIFDIEKKTWSVYLGPPASSEPVHVYNIY